MISSHNDDAGLASDPATTAAAAIASVGAVVGGAKRKRNQSSKIQMDDSAPPKKQQVQKKAKTSSEAAATTPAAGEKKKKRKKRKSKRMKEKAAAVDVTKQNKSAAIRDHSAELTVYLSNWSAHRNGDVGSQWKFNKRLQVWALDHCFNKRVIDNSLFKELLPYVATVQGNAAERLSARALRLIQNNGETEVTEEDERQELEEEQEVDDAAVLAEKAKVKAEVAKVALKRALKVHSQVQICKN